MKLTFRFSVITKMLGGLAAGSLAIATLGEPVFGDVVYDLAANPPAVAVMQVQNALIRLVAGLGRRKARWW
jgi:hypothetical protein